MAIHENINPSSNKESMIEEIKIIDNKLIKSTSELKGSWRILKTLLVAEEKQFIPNIISILIKNIENMTQI
jgi:hypothetical protein